MKGFGEIERDTQILSLSYSKDEEKCWRNKLEARSGVLVGTRMKKNSSKMPEGKNNHKYIHSN